MKKQSKYEKFTEALYRWKPEHGIHDLLDIGEEMYQAGLIPAGVDVAILNLDLGFCDEAQDAINATIKEMADIDAVQYVAARKHTAKLVSAFSKQSMNIRPEHLQTLWYEDDEGHAIPHDPDSLESPEGATIQVSRFPRTLDTRYLRSVFPEEVAACDHPEEYVRPTYGWIDGIEGRECVLCKGSQVKQVSEPWPLEWDAEGSRELLTCSSSWSEDLALAIATSGDFSLPDAIIIAAESCERCMNALAYDYGLDWGYPEYSEEWELCGTSCQFCEGE